MHVPIDSSSSSSSDTSGVLSSGASSGSSGGSAKAGSYSQVTRLALSSCAESLACLLADSNTASADTAAADTDMDVVHIDTGMLHLIYRSTMTVKRAYRMPQCTPYCRTCACLVAYEV
jgi:hypothetical protein